MLLPASATWLPAQLLKRDGEVGLVGYEINFNRYFYVYEPPRPLEEIEADIIVAATGFRLCVMGDIPFEVDGRPVNWHDTVTYRGMMFTGVPNMAWVFGYFRASA